MKPTPPRVVAGVRAGRGQLPFVFFFFAYSVSCSAISDATAWSTVRPSVATNCFPIGPTIMGLNLGVSLAMPPDPNWVVCVNRAPRR